MPAFIVTLPSRTGFTLEAGANSMVVFAVNAASAVDVAQGHFTIPTGADAMWDSATAVEVIAETNLTGYELSINLPDVTVPFEVIARGNALAMVSAAVDGGGATYSDDDILTLVGGTFVRAATFRVTGETGNVIDTVEVVDPGEYTVLPSPLTGLATTGGGDGNATLDVTADTLFGDGVFFAQIVGLLNANAQIAAASIDMSEGAAGTRLLVIASGGGGDDLGDKVVIAEFRKNGAPVAGLLSTITDEGAANAALSVAVPAAASMVLPRSTAFKTV